MNGLRYRAAVSFCALAFLAPMALRTAAAEDRPGYDKLTRAQVLAVVEAGNAQNPAVLYAKDLSGVDLSGVDFRGANLSASVLNRANLRGANLSRCSLTE